MTDPKEAAERIVADLKAAIKDPDVPVQYSPALIGSLRLLRDLAENRPRMWCETCCTVTTDGKCHCETPKLVDYADAGWAIVEELRAEIGALHAFLRGAPDMSDLMATRVKEIMSADPDRFRKTSWMLNMTRRQLDAARSALRTDGGEA